MKTKRIKVKKNLDKRTKENGKCRRKPKNYIIDDPLPMQISSENLAPWSKSINYIPIKYVSKVSGNAWKLFSILHALAEGRPNKENYGCCKPSNEELSKLTGISFTNMSKYLRELRNMKLISVKAWKEGKKINVKTKRIIRVIGYQQNSR